MLEYLAGSAHALPGYGSDPGGYNSLPSISPLGWVVYHHEVLSHLAGRSGLILAPRYLSRGAPLRDESRLACPVTGRTTALLSQWLSGGTRANA
jgi:hypothetical protein